MWWKKTKTSGLLTIYEAKTLEVVKRVHTVNHAIKSIALSRDGSLFLLNCADRVIRVYDAQKYCVLKEFQDVVNRMQWKKCCFSGNGDYVIGASAEKDVHSIYIWNRAFGQLVKIFQANKEVLLDFAYHPTRAVMVTCTKSGLLHIWAKTYSENWSAFAPDFEQLEENVEYVEREDEFDLELDEKLCKEAENLEDTIVDISTIEKIGAYSSDEDDDLTCLPLVIPPPQCANQSLTNQNISDSEPSHNTLLSRRVKTNGSSHGMSKTITNIIGSDTTLTSQVKRHDLIERPHESEQVHQHTTKEMLDLHRPDQQTLKTHPDQPVKTDQLECLENQRKLIKLSGRPAKKIKAEPDCID